MLNLFLPYKFHEGTGSQNLIFFMICIVEVAVCHEMYIEVNRILNRHSNKM